jgi:general stress protein YciG
MLAFSWRYDTTEGTMDDTKDQPKSSGRGFASMTPEQRRALGSRGGKTAHERGTANRFTPETASVAGRVPHERGTAHKWTADEAREAGRKGGTATRRRRASTPPDEGE